MRNALGRFLQLSMTMLATQSPFQKLLQPRLFCAFDEALRPHLKSIPLLRLLKQVHQTIEHRARPVHALRDRREPKAEAILTRLGFAPVGWCGGDEVWIWGE